MNETILLSMYQIVYIIAGVSGIFAIGYKILASRLKTSWGEDIEKRCNIDICKIRIRDVVDGKFELVKKEVTDLKETLKEIKVLISNQQETLLAIQLGITELKPKLESLEKRVDKLEEKVR